MLTYWLALRILDGASPASVEVVISSSVGAPSTSLAVSGAAAASLSSTVQPPTTTLSVSLAAAAAIASTVGAPATSLAVTAGVVVSRYVRPGESARAEVTQSATALVVSPAAGVTIS